jgi:putative phosphoribosyl transferase
MFSDREEAGLRLAEKLIRYNNDKNTVVVAIPRGGVPIGSIIAKTLNLPLEIVLSKKIGHPINKEYAIGAITLKNRILNDDILGVSQKYIDEETIHIRKILNNRDQLYHGSLSPISLKNKIVILVDDGVATGNTLISSLELINLQEPLEIIVALPVASNSALKIIKSLDIVTRTICLLVPEYFQAVGQFYEKFNQVADDEVIKLLKESNSSLLFTSN